MDDSWATIGSANLDGLSLDYNLLLSPLVFGETTACELNLNVLPPAPGSTPSSPSQCDAGCGPSISEFTEDDALRSFGAMVRIINGS